MAETNDGNVNIGVKFDTDKVAKEVDGLKGKITKLTGSNILKSVTGLGAAFLTVKTAVNAAKKVITETTAAYRVQAKAEKQLEAAAKNNPYLDSTSVKQLKDYASHLQSIGTVGDETLIPLMAQLASAGRTQTEIQNIMSAALDVSASGMMSLDSAVTQLNATFNGNVGLMGRQIGELKNLTAEELKNGKAVDIVKNKFAGMSQEVTQATGTSEQLKNAWGDLKEEIGAPFEKALSPMRQFFTELISGWTDARKKRREYEEAKEANESGNSTIQTLKTEVDAEINKLNEMQKGYNAAAALLQKSDKEIKKSAEYIEYSTYSDSATPLQDFKEKQQAIIDNYNTQLDKVKDLNAQLKDAAANQKAQEEAAAQAAADAQNAADADQKNKDALKFMQDNEQALNTQIEQIKLEAQLKGEEADQQEILNAYIQSYIDLVTSSSLVTENNPYSKKRLAELQNYAAGIQDLTIDTAELDEKIKEFLGDSDADDNTKLSDVIEQNIILLAEQRNALDETSDAWKAYNDKIIELEKLKGDVVAQEEENAKNATLENAQKLTDNLKNYVSQFTEIVSQVTDIATKNNEQSTNEELTKLSEQYTDGLITYEEYCEKKGEINKKSAEEEYKINLWSWQASLLTAAANIASGVISCLTEQGVPTALKFVNMALVAASGAAQLATLSQNKPTAPAFANGGVVGGNSYTGDHVNARLNSGEMVLNASQQAQLWKAANTGSGGGVSLNVDIINNMGDSAKVTSQITAQGLRLTVDKLVKASLTEGRYNQSLADAQNLQNGVTYL